MMKRLFDDKGVIENKQMIKNVENDGTTLEQ